MANTKTIITSSGITAIITALLILGGIAITSDKAYYCQDRDIVMECDKLTAYYGLDNGKCWNDEVGNKLCRTGWERFTVNDENTDADVPVKYVASTGNSICTKSGCVAI